MKNEYLKIKVNVILTEIPLEININVEPVDWLTSDPQTQACTVWSHIEKEYPLAMGIAEQNSEWYPKTSWIESMEIVD
jgi:hypothetical protein